MNILQKQPNPSGAYPPIQSWSGEIPPEGYYKITANTTELYNGFITPTVTNGVVTSFLCNTTAWEEWKASLPPEKPPEPTTEEKQAEQIRAQNATITMLFSVLSDLQADVEALQV